MQPWHYRMLLEAQILQTRVEGMKAENLQSAICGNSLAYTEEAFHEIVVELEALLRDFRVC